MTQELGTISPVHLAGYIGNTYTFVCFSKTEVKWSKLQGHIHPRHTTVMGNILWLNNVMEKDSGIYICQGTEINWKPFEAQVELLVGGTVNN